MLEEKSVDKVSTTDWALSPFVSVKVCEFFQNPVMIKKFTTLTSLFKERLGMMGVLIKFEI